MEQMEQIGLPCGKKLRKIGVHNFFRLMESVIAPASGWRRNLKMRGN
jgi:hypothetical protein